MRSESTSAEHKVTIGVILSLALPALGVLAAPPLYLLLDTAVIGRLGAIPLAALATGSTVFSVVTTQLTFLAYGTTARASRAFGRGDRRGAIGEGVQASWVAVAVGSLLALVILGGAPYFSLWLADDPGVADAATSWLRITAFAIPLVLLAQAGNGWLRGVQNTASPLFFVLSGLGPAALTIIPLVHYFGLPGSAIAVLLGESITAALFVWRLYREARNHEVLVRPSWELIKRQLVLGRDLILRSLSFQVAFLSAAGVAGRISAEALGGHQVMLQLWNLVSLVLDSLAIAAQTLVGAALGVGSVAVARWTARRVTAWSGVISVVIGLIFAVGVTVIPGLFSTDEGVQSAITAGPWWILVAMVPLGGIVFALDGVLLGASDAAYLRNATIASVILGFLPPVWLTAFFGWGLSGVWCGLLGMMVLRLGFVILRYRGTAWTGADD